LFPRLNELIPEGDNAQSTLAPIPLIPRLQGDAAAGYKQTMTSMAAQPVPTQHPDVD
jgi:hypothetical protein